MATDARFSCDACGQSYPWKRKHSGMKAKCACGAVIVVPPAPTLVAGRAKHATPPPALLAAAAAAPQTFMASARTAPYHYPSASREPDDDDELDVSEPADPIRDIYVPVALLAAGFIAMVLWALLAAERESGLGILALLGSGVTTAIQTGILLGLALLIAPHAGLSLGTFWSALLKLAAIVIFTDALLMWLEEIISRTGALPHSDHLRGWGSVRWIELVLAAGLIAILMRYLFDMDRKELAWVAMPIAIASWIVGLLLKLILVAALDLLATPMTDPSVAAADEPTTQASTASPSAAPRQDVTPRDRTISSRIEEAGPFLKTAQEWNERRPLRSRGQKQLFERLYEAGATRMYVDLQGAIPAIGLSGTLYIELPLDPAGRAACFEAYKTFCGDVRMEVDPKEATDDGRRYLVFQLKPR